MSSPKVCPHDPAVLDGVYDDEHGRLCDRCARMVGWDL